jgi:antitoxin YefM
MRTLTFSESRANYAQTLDAVVNDREEVVITRAGHESVVIVALSEWNSIKETLYLLRSPANARRLFEGIEELQRGGGTVRELIEDDGEEVH